MSTVVRAACLALLLALVAACASGGSATAGPPGAAVVESGRRGWGGTPITDGYPLPQVSFRDTSGRTVTPGTASDKPVTLVFFGYSHCPDICNVVLATIASALRGTRPEVRSKVGVLFVTTDPDRDTGPVVRTYLDRFDRSFQGLVAPAEVVEQAARALYISYEKPDGTRGGSYDVTHGTYTTGFLDGSARVVWAEDTSVADLRADLARLAALA